jgi:hypothetical protein
VAAPADPSEVDPRSPRRAAALLVALTLAALAYAGCADAGDPRVRPTAACPAQIVPAYQNAWSTVKQVLARPGRVRVVVLGGSGITYRQKLRAVERLQAEGVKVVDYTFTRLPGPYDESTFGDRPLREVKAQVAAAERTYGVDGMFVDNVSPEPAKQAYYKAISEFIRSRPGKFVVFNGLGAPGGAALADVFIEFEGEYADFLTFRPPPWLASLPASKRAALVHGVPRGAGAAAAANGRRVRAGNVFLTDAAQPSPYRRMPLLAPPACD